MGLIKILKQHCKFKRDHSGKVVEHCEIEPQQSEEVDQEQESDKVVIDTDEKID